ncbi:MAG: 2-oxo acid dehydrogenase subunit E2 [Rickettsiaceae bacterium H1]|nr:2-oxo acid dehydrogenase subunit E2 [Rickettsiaceae bacterium H1]
MPIEVLMPALSPTMTKGKLVKWLVKVGDSIEIGTVIAEVETDKATMEVEAFEEGKIGKILVKADTNDVAVNSPIAIILLEGETESDLTNISSKKEETKVEKEEKIEKEVTSEEKKKDERIKASPLAKNIAKEKNIDLAQIKVGSGPYGRIVKEDVLNFVNNNELFIPDKVVEKVKSSYLEVSTMRSVIAKRLIESKQEIPHFYLSVDCNLNNLISLKKEINTEDTKITINDFIIKAMALALEKFPEVNSSWLGNKIERYGSVDVAVAVSLDEGLITPIVKNANKKALKVISSEIKSLAKKAKRGSLSSEEYLGGSITVSNLGMFGIKNFAAIINPPQSGILAVGAAEEKAVINQGEVIAATIMSMTLSVDHRVVDGALGAQFLNKIKHYLEYPVNILIS